MRKVTAITMFQTAAGYRMSIVYSEINEEGVIVKDNVRVDRIIVDSALNASVVALMQHAQTIIDELEE